MEIFKVNEETCKQCGACAAVCHLGLIDFQEKSYPKPFSVTDQMCSKCAACMIVCPTESFIHRDITYEQCPPIKPALKVSFNRCAQLLKSRRSIRSFKDTPVPREDIARAIDAARYSPTGNNVQDVEWLVIDDKELVQRFRKIGDDWMIGVLKNVPMYAPMVDIWVKRKEAGIDDFLRGAPVIVSAYAKKDGPSPQPDCTIALAYFDLAAISLGLGCLIDGFFNYAAISFPPIKDAIALPEGYQIYGSLAVGYPKYKYQRIPVRNHARITWR